MGEEERQDARSADETDTGSDGEPAGAPASNGQDEGSSQDTGTEGRKDISDTTAPSVGPHTTIERKPPEERLARHEQSGTDAMGLHKRREVVGHSYGPSLAKQLTLYGAALAVIALIVVGFILLAGELDQAPATNPDEAPWSDPNAPQEPPAPLQ